MSEKSAKFWIDKFKLERHPIQNGYFKEVFRDDLKVKHPESKEERSASTLIYYLHLPEGPLNSETLFFKLKSSETTHFYTGKPVTIYYINDDKKLDKIVLGHENDLNYSVKPGTWFSRFLDVPKRDGNQNEEEFALVGVSLAPGFDMKDLKTAKYSEIL